MNGWGLIERKRMERERACGNSRCPFLLSSHLPRRRTQARRAVRQAPTSGQGAQVGQVDGVARGRGGGGGDVGRKAGGALGVSRREGGRRLRGSGKGSRPCWCCYCCCGRRAERVVGGVHLFLSFREMKKQRGRVETADLRLFSLALYPLVKTQMHATPVLCLARTPPVSAASTTPRLAAAAVIGRGRAGGGGVSAAAFQPARPSRRGAGCTTPPPRRAGK